MGSPSIDNKTSPRCRPTWSAGPSSWTDCSRIPELSSRPNAWRSELVRSIGLIPIQPRMTRPLSLICSMTPRTRSMGIAKPMPSVPESCASTAVLMPISSPRALTSAPPELPALIAASVWMKSSKVKRSRSPRPVALTMPWVTVLVRP